MIVEDINSIYGTSNVSKAQIYTLAGYQESNALDVCVCANPKASFFIKFHFFQEL